MTDNDRQHRVTVTEAAAILGVSERTVWRRVKAGKLEIDRSVTPHLVDVGAYIDNDADSDSDVSDTLRHENAGLVSRLRAENERLRAELEHRDAMIERLERENDRMATVVDQLSERSRADQIIMSQLAEAAKPGPSIWQRLLPWRSESDD